MQLTSSIKENPRLRAAAEELKKGGVKVGDAVTEALRTMEESELARAVRVALRFLGIIIHSYFPPPPFFLLDIQGNCGCILDDRLHDRAHSQHRGVQNPRGNGH